MLDVERAVRLERVAKMDHDIVSGRTYREQQIKPNTGHQTCTRADGGLAKLKYDSYAGRLYNPPRD